ncbi:hypothetical protein LTR28_003560 [Elasticomyces elasticus]|nr:hypothetical protein LTR28_003560 [Elasticomyces elasticus]
MYLDPWRNEDEVLVGDLEVKLREMGIPSSLHAQYVGPVTTSELVIRTGRNIFRSIQDAQGVLVPTARPTWHLKHPDPDSAFYSMLWSAVLVSNSLSADGQEQPVRQHRRSTYLPHLLQHFHTHHIEDISLVERHLLPLFHNRDEVRQILLRAHEIWEGDRNARPVVRRDWTAKNVLYRVGQVFEHRRYGYEGVVVGWDAQCNATEQWCSQMQVDRLQQGRQQSFYHVLVDDKSTRYVAEENIHALDSQPSEPLLLLAGRYFKRWDAASMRFVSNVRDEYPDD